MAAAAVAVGHCLAVQLDLVAPGVGRLSSGARRIFVLGLGEQPIVLASDPGEPFHISLSIVQTYVDRWVPAAPPSAIADMGGANAMGGAGVPLVESQLKLRHRELRLSPRAAATRWHSLGPRK